MAVFHYLHLRTFAHETEDPDKVRQALRTAGQGDKLRMEEVAVEGSHKNRILILDAEQPSAQAAKRLFQALAHDDPDGFHRLLGELPERIDENLNFHLRLDKQEAFLGRMVLASSDDAITVRGKVRSFAPRRQRDPRREAEGPLRTFLEGLPRGQPTTIGRGGDNIQA